MFPFPIATPQGCDIQIFNRSPAGGGTRGTRTWNKPVGVSHIYMLLIGAGGGGAGPGVTGAGGGGSGAITVWYGAAQHVPNNLFISVGAGGVGVSGAASFIKALNNIGLLNANGGTAASLSSGGAGGAADVESFFTATGFFRSVAGQTGASAGGTVSASSTTFLSGGAGGTSSANNPAFDATANYGYVSKGALTSVGITVSGNDGNSGTFQMQPIVFGTGGGGGGGSGSVAGNGGTGGKGGIGCGGGGGGFYVDSVAASAGGDGLVLIASW